MITKKWQKQKNMWKRSVTFLSDRLSFYVSLNIFNLNVNIDCYAFSLFLVP